MLTRPNAAGGASRIPSPSGGPPAALERRHEFPTMGMTAALVGPSDGPGDPAYRRAARAVQRVFHRIDARFSRFRSDSELSRVNADAGRWQMVSGEFAELTGRALRAAAATDGLFDPTVLPALVAAGYDRDFAEVLVAGLEEAPSPAPAPAAEWRRVDLDGPQLHLPEGTALDFGGIAKGWAADLAAEAAREFLPWALVDASGDLRLAGEPPGGIVVGVGDPWSPRTEFLQMRMEGGALATSSVVGRTWGPGLHHLIDPRTGRPADGRVVQATVWADTCTDAEVWATYAVLSGREALAHVHTVLVMDDGEVRVNLPGERGRRVAGAGSKGWSAC